MKAVGEDEVFKVIKTGRSKSKSLGVRVCPHSLYYNCDCGDVAFVPTNKMKLWSGGD